MKMFVVATFALASIAGAARAQQDTVWTDLYLRDLAGLRALIAADHPGAVDTANPQFARKLQSEYEGARAATVSSYDGYRYFLTRFVNGFEDAHLKANFRRPFSNIRQAGINVVYQSGRFVVGDVDLSRYPKNGNLKGATLQSCAGESARSSFERRVLSWRGRPRIEADWYELAPLFFVDFGRPTPEPPQSCTFRSGTQETVVTLDWKSTTMEELNQITGKSSADLPLLMERLRGDSVLWLNVPTFSINREPEVSRMRAVIDTLSNHAASVRLVVFDLRGNSGGSSTWGDDLTRAVFGAEWLNDARNWLFDGVFTEWRVSAGNVENGRALVNQIARRDGPDSPSARRMQTFVDSLEAALQRGQAYLGNRTARSGVPKPQPTHNAPKIVVITSAACFSACLDFLDRLRLHPAVTHVGQPTGVDSDYMENWGRPVSDLVSLAHPMKVYRNRRRANNEPYLPHVRYDGDLFDTAALRAWVLKQF